MTNVTSARPHTATRSPDATTLAPRLLAWFDTHGRKDLPWQRDPNPYRVWVSEVMLQQTQARTVEPYFNRFMSSFPTVEALAAADLDAVLHLWTGLGYYARARNLHAAARLIAERHGGTLPEDIQALRRLPGVGRSTAGAILALSRSQRHPILDGNARRVLSRYFGVDGEPGRPETERTLWRLAEACTPFERVAAYTQAIMDLGALVCRRRDPACAECPLQSGCVARATGRQSALPPPRAKRPRPHREAVAVLLAHPTLGVLLQERPPRGLWGGLASLPMFDSPDDALRWLASVFGSVPQARRALPPYKHAFTHFDLTLHPIHIPVQAEANPIPGHLWYNPADPPRIGLSKPALDLLHQIQGDAAFS